MEEDLIDNNVPLHKNIPTVDFIKKQTGRKENSMDDPVKDYILNMVKQAKDLGVPLAEEMLPEGVDVEDLLEDSNSLLYNFVYSQPAIKMQGVMKDYDILRAQDQEEYVQKHKSFNITKTDAQSIHSFIKKGIKDKSIIQMNEFPDSIKESNNQVIDSQNAFE